MLRMSGPFQTLKERLGWQGTINLAPGLPPHWSGWQTRKGSRDI
jgi:hypothetical protein